MAALTSHSEMSMNTSIKISMTAHKSSPRPPAMVSFTSASHRRVTAGQRLGREEEHQLACRITRRGDMLSGTLASQRSSRETLRKWKQILNWFDIRVQGRASHEMLGAPSNELIEWPYLSDSFMNIEKKHLNEFSSRGFVPDNNTLPARRDGG